MAVQATSDQFTIVTNELSSFNLTKLWIQKSEELELSATAVAVMTALLWHFNPNKKYVFPHQETIGKRIKRSIATVKRALTELKKAGYIVSSRTRNGNLYAFTKKFFELFEPSKTTSGAIPEAHNELCMNHEQTNEHINNNVVVLKNFSKGAEEETQKELSSTTSSVSSKVHYDLTIIPDILKAKAESGKIRNLKAYWGSLRPHVKIEYWELDTAEKLKIQQKAELKKQAEIQKAKELAEKRAEQEELAKPLNEQYTREQALTFVSNVYHLNKSFAYRGLAGELMQTFGISENEL